MCVQAHLFVIMCVERQAEQVGGIFGGAVWLGSSLVLHVLSIKSWSMGVTGGGPDELSCSACVAQNGLQLPDLGSDAVKSQIIILWLSSSGIRT